MPHRFEPATSGRAKCRGCGGVLARGEWRFGECLPNPFADGDLMHWFHPPCAAFKRPEALLEALLEGLAAPPEVPERAELERLARAASAHRRLARIDGAERAPSAKARCRACKAPIERGTWRIRLVFHDEGRFSPGGFLHLACRAAYFECAPESEALRDPVLRFSAGLEPGERAELERELATRPPPA